MGTKFIDEVQQYGEQLAKDVFNCDVADLRLLSGHVADLTFLACFAKPKDKVVCVSRADGGCPGISKHGISDALGFKMLDFPFLKAQMNIETEKAESFILKEKPRLVVFGASLFLFPHPVRQLAKVSTEIGAHVGYDGSHVLGLIAGKQFQDPLREGASTLFGFDAQEFLRTSGRHNSR
jgi:glycine hydroxymethyltransferase